MGLGSSELPGADESIDYYYNTVSLNYLDIYNLLCSLTTIVYQ
jgi:hypothetical protein